MDAKSIAEQGTILRGLVGSGVHGVAIAGTDDRDEMGVCVEPPEAVIGLTHFEQYVYRTAEERLRAMRAAGVEPLGEFQEPRSQPGDLDLTVYSLRKWCRLALKGNPTVLLLLFVPEASLVACTPLGGALRANAGLFAARTAAAPFRGYLEAQKQRMLGERGGHRVSRPELVAQYGFDTKFAGHMLRLGYQGIEFLETGRITLPLPETERQRILAVRRGEVDQNDLLTEVGLLEERLADLADTSPLPATPDAEGVNRFLQAAYRTAWGWDRP